MKLYDNPNGDIDMGHARVYLTQGDSVMKIDLSGRIVNLILAVAALRRNWKGQFRGAVILQGGTRYARYATGFRPGEKLVHRSYRVRRQGRGS